MVVVDPPPHRAPSPEQTVRRRQDDTGQQASYGKRRSMSVGEIELKQATSVASALTPLPKGRSAHPRESTFSQVIADFKGELSQLDPISDSALDLRDPSTPARRAAALARCKSNEADPHAPAEEPLGAFLEVPGTTAYAPAVPQAPVASTSAATLKPSQPAAGAYLPPRSLSLQTPSRPRSTSSSASSMRPAATRSTSHPNRYESEKVFGVPTLVPARSTSRLRVQRQPTGFSSEPSLAIGGDEARSRSFVPWYLSATGVTHRLFFPQ